MSDFYSYATLPDKTLLERMLQQLGDKALNLGGRIIFSVICFFIGVQLIKFVRKIVRHGMEKAKADVGVVQFVDSFIKAALYVILIFMIAASFGVDAASIVAILGSAGVAIGLAIQGSLANLAGGVLLLILKPFKVGDFIQESSSGKEGVVTQIQIFYTKLTTPDNKVVILPNGNLANNSIVNFSTETYRRVDIPVSISYGSDIKKAKTVLTNLLEAEEKIVKDRERMVFVDELADSGIRLNIRFWVVNADYWEEKWKITENAKYALDEAGIEIPFPQLDVHMRE